MYFQLLEQDLPKLTSALSIWAQAESCSVWGKFCPSFACCSKCDKMFYGQNWVLFIQKWDFSKLWVLFQMWQDVLWTKCECCSLRSEIFPSCKCWSPCCKICGDHSERRLFQAVSASHSETRISHIMSDELWVLFDMFQSAVFSIYAWWSKRSEIILRCECWSLRMRIKIFQSCECHSSWFYPAKTKKDCYIPAETPPPPAHSHVPI